MVMSQPFQAQLRKRADWTSPSARNDVKFARCINLPRVKNSSPSPLQCTIKRRNIAGRAIILLVFVLTVYSTTQVCGYLDYCPAHRSLRTAKMAWISSGSSNKALISNLVGNKLITSDRVKNAMLGV